MSEVVKLNLVSFILKYVKLKQNFKIKFYEQEIFTLMH